jgi:hypothetical protein
MLMTREEIEQRTDELARKYAETHDKEMIEELSKFVRELEVPISTVLNMSRRASRNGLRALFFPSRRQILFAGLSRGRAGWPNIRQAV